MDESLKHDQNFIDYGITIPEEPELMPDKIDKKIFIYYAIGIIASLILYLIINIITG